ncbi:MAG: SIR2 family protein [Proteobacteria bacterium]|nr:SIR2 family protein [Pseudomonadota bacterium]
MKSRDESPRSASSSVDVYGQSQKAIEAIGAAWKNGGTLVPILGAGLSVECGMPAISEIERYLAMVRAYVDKGMHRPAELAQPESGPAKKLAQSSLFKRLDESFKERLLRFLEVYGWPERFDLQEEMHHRLGDANEVDRAIKGAKEGLLRKYVKDWRVNIHKRYEEVLRRCTLKAPESDEDQKAFEKAKKALLKESSWDLFGDWRKLIGIVTEYNGDYADALFERLYRGHKPGTSHLFWALLTRLMGLPLFLTMNFDPFLERAFRDQGIEHTVFGVEHGNWLPPASLVCKTVAIIKLHGDTHRLLLDERLDRPPGPEYLATLSRCMPRYSIPIVMGCGGGDPRIMAIIEHLVKRKMDDEPGDAGLRLVWLHFNKNVPDEVANLKRTYNEAIQVAQVTQPGLFLSHLYAYLSKQHPASRVPYATHLPTLIGFSACAEKEGTDPPGGSGPDANAVKFYRNGDDTVGVYSTLHRAKHPAPYEYSASSQLARRVQKDYVDLRGSVLVWINLEMHYSVAGIVGRILAQCRAHDPRLPAVHIPYQNGEFSGSSSDQDDIPLWIHLIKRALNRGRYILAFDGLEAFSWRPTVHHGTTDAAGQLNKVLFKFLSQLLSAIESPFGKSSGNRAFLSIDQPKVRHNGDVGLEELQRQLCGLLEAFRASPSKPIPVAGGTEPHPDDWSCELQDVSVGDPLKLENIVVFCPRDAVGGRTADDRRDHALALLCLSCFRRSRHLVALRKLLAYFHGHRTASSPAGDGLKSREEELVEAFCRERYLTAVEGAGFCMGRELRDRIYSANSQYASDHCIRALYDPNRPDHEVLRSAAQCFLLALSHDRIARYYHRDNYIMSSDPAVFLEYLYHRVSAIRYQTRLIIAVHCVVNNQLVVEWCDLVSRYTPSNFQPWSSGLWPEHNASHTDCATYWRKWVERAREVMLRQLLHALGRTRTALQIHAHSAQIIEWFHWILEDDVGMTRNSSRFHVLPLVHRGGDDDKRWARQFDDEYEKIIAGMREALFDMCAGYYLDAGSFAQCMKMRSAQLLLAYRDVGGESQLRDTEYPGSWLDAFQSWLGTRESTSPESSDIEAIKPIMGILHCILTELRCGTLPLSPCGGSSPGPDQRALEPKVETLLRCLVQLKDLLEGWLENKELPGERAAMQERYLRALCLCVDAHIEHQLLPLKERWNLLAGQEKEDAKKHLKLIRDAVAQGLDQVHALQPEPAGDPRRDLGYLYYRTRLHVSRGFHAWLEGGAAGFDQADRDFERARAGVEPHDGVRTARAELAWVETLLVQSRHLLDRGEGDLALDCAAVKKAHGILSRAGEALQRGRDALGWGQRKLQWWRVYYQVWAQYQSEWVLWHLADLQCDFQGLAWCTRSEGKNIGVDDNDAFWQFMSERPQRVVRVIERVKRGLCAIYNARILQPCDRKGQKPVDEVLLRIWVELMAGSCIYGVTVAATAGLEQLVIRPGDAHARDESREHLYAQDGPNDLDGCVVQIWKYWQHLNQITHIEMAPLNHPQQQTYLDAERPPERVLRIFGTGQGDWRNALFTQLRSENAKEPQPQTRDAQTAQLRQETVAVTKDLLAADFQ